MKKIFLSSITFLACYVIFCNNSYSQLQNLGKGKYQYRGTGISVTGISSAAFPNLAALTNDARQGTLFVRAGFDGGDFYLSDQTFSIKLDFTVVLTYAGCSSISVTGSITVNNTEPEGVFLINLNNYLCNQDFPVQAELTFTGLTDLILISPYSYALALSNLRLYLDFDAEYKIDCNGISVPDLVFPLQSTVNSKVVRFRWNTTNVPFPNYEIQILRLFNEDPAPLYTADEDVIRVVQPFDWDRALSMETESAGNGIDLSIGEGQGYYVWRVRPIGTFYEGGAANSANWGTWLTPALVPPVAIDLTSLLNRELLYFQDSDKGRNYIYSRTFTEGKTNISEKITYANSLLQIKQTQVYLPSLTSTLITQTVQDFTGRPALATLPVPVANGLDKYQETFLVRDNSTTAYTAEDFDDESNLSPGSPLAVEDNSGPYLYYSDNNSADRQIPNAEGYPFTRTVFENDASGRVKEQSGVGKAQMIGDQASDMGRTVRTLYSTPSQQELDIIFGNEAPRCESVFKTVTVDQNNTASVTYTNKEGKVIATSLAFGDGINHTDDSNSLVDLNETPNDINVDDKVTQNVKTPGGFVSTKRISIIQACPLTVTYDISCYQLQDICNAGPYGIDCKYDVKVVIYNLDDLTTPPTDLGQQIVTCSGTNTWNHTLQVGNYLIQKILISTGQSPQLVQGENSADIQLKPITNWIESTLSDVDCEEELYQFYNDLFLFVKHFQVGNLSNTPLYTQFTTTTDYTLHLTRDVNCPSCSNGSANFSQCSGVIPDEVCFHTFYVSHVNDYILVLSDANGNPIDLWAPSGLPTAPATIPAYVDIKTPCCDRFTISVKYKPPFKCPAALDMQDLKQDLAANQVLWADDLSGTTPYLKINENYLYDPTASNFNLSIERPFLPDYEGYAISMLANCFDPSTPMSTAALTFAKDVLYTHMLGWNRPGMFNIMVFHMLTDIYACEGLNTAATGPCAVATPLASCNQVPTPPTPPFGYNMDCLPAALDNISCTQYTCADLAKCWTGIVNLLIDTYCPNSGAIDFSAQQPGGGISNGYDEQNSDPAGGKHNSQIDDNFDIGVPWPFDWFLETLMSARLRNKQSIPPQNAGAIANPPPLTLDVNVVETFLNCTGYRFADIINHINSLGPDDHTQCTLSPEYVTGNPTYGSVNCFRTLDDDFDTDLQNGEYDVANTFLNLIDKLPPAHPGTAPFSDEVVWHGVIAYPYSTSPFDAIHKIFNNIKNPLYAFKYFEYEYFSFNELELSVCFRDPNICIDFSTQNPVPCCGGTLINPTPCNFCGIGELICPLTKENWSCGQRYTFHEMLKNYIDPVGEPQTLSPTVHNCQYYFTPDPNPPFNGLSPAQAKAEEMTERCSTACDSKERRAEFRLKVIQMFNDRCYDIGGCKASATDNVVPEEDIDVIVDALVAQCTTQCSITTAACGEEYCRNIGTDPTLWDNDNFNGNNDGILNPTYPCAGTNYPTSNEHPFLSVPCTPCTSCPDGTTNQIATIKYGVGGCADCITTPCAYPPSTSTTIVDYSDHPNWQTDFDDFPYGELTLYLQAKGWDFDLNIQSKCSFEPSPAPGHYAYNPTYTGPAWYVYNQLTHAWDLQDPMSLNCNAPCTFMERNDYVSVINPNVPPDPNAQPGLPAASPAILIEVDQP